MRTFYPIRKATRYDLSRIAEIYVFNNRINYFPIFNDESFSFGKLQVISLADQYFGDEEVLKNLYVYEDGLIKGFTQTRERRSANYMWNHFSKARELEAA